MKHTAATRAKLSAMRRGEKNPFFGKKHTPETRAKLAAVLRRFSATRKYELTPAKVKIPSGIQLGYLVGLVDGEGSITFRGKRPAVVIYNTNKALMKWLQSHVGGSVGAADRRGRLICWTWSCGSALDVYTLCNALLPHLVVKALAARKAVSHLEKKYGDRLNG